MIDVRDAPRELRAVVAAWTVLERDVQAVIRRRTREVIGPRFVSTVERYALTKMDRVVLTKGAKVKPGNPPAFQAATSRRKLRGGIVPADDWAPWEFGALSRDKVTTYRRRSKGGGSHTVRRHASRQLPTRKRSGRVVFRAVREAMPSAVSEWASILVRAVMDGSEGKG